MDPSPPDGAPTPQVFPWEEGEEYGDPEGFGAEGRLSGGLQEFRSPARIEHPIWNRKNQKVETVEGRVRLCPYCFVADGKATLGGVLATIVPTDKKVVHGMEDACLVPCRIEG